MLCGTSPTILYYEQNYNPVLATCQICSPNKAFAFHHPTLLAKTAGRESTYSVLSLLNSWQVRSYEVGARIQYNIEQPSGVVVLND